MPISRVHPLASGNHPRRWIGRFIYFLSGAVLLLVSMGISFFFLVIGVLNEAVNVLFTLAAKAVKPRKFEND